MAKRYFVESLLYFLLITVPMEAGAVSPACAKFSTLSFQGVGGAYGTYINYATGPFLQGDAVTIGIGAVFPGTGQDPNDGFSLVDGVGNVLAGPQELSPFIFQPRLSYVVKGSVDRIGLKNLGADFIFVDFASCEAAPVIEAVPGISESWWEIALAVFLLFSAAAKFGGVFLRKGAT